ncbi:neuroblast differentiation-associated protein AHNAK-like isoform X2 [Siniperca chuatsi]|nr:neuroblast differentiation-associated protein AHNAK-like isoform X2 [Siniperca chuatsi]
MFEKRSTPKMSKLKEVPSPESGVIVKTAKDGCAEGLIYGGGGNEGIFIKEVVPESPASKSLKLKEGDQILSATVYFDNMSYEDAIQILEHAQAYKVKLCLKRKPDITETEPAIESDVIPEDDLYAPEMREQGKTKRRGDARISWPKFPSFGKGRKSRFTRSHSSSEADEQRKLELSPTTSDTESPIKSQDALKGKKKNKIKLPVLTKRGRVSSSEDQDTDVPTSGQISGNILQTNEASDMLSPERLESPSGETPEVYVTEHLKVVEDLRLEQNDQKLTEPHTVQHKVELITISSTLKTEDLTVALADQESSSGIKSPDGKKKKKERSELKIKILGKDRLHKKDAKAKSSPKRLKTLGASIEIADQPENEKSDVIPSFESHTKLQEDQLALDANTQIISSESSRVISAKSVTTQMEMSVPKVELDISDVAFIQQSPQKGEEKTKKGKDIKQKQETKTGPTFKLPKIGFSEIPTEETIQKMYLNVEECPAKLERLTTEGTEEKEDPYERLSKSNLSRTKLPKREDIEIPGMEDMSMRTTAKTIKEPKAVSTGHYEEIQAETEQLSIDVDSVKEAVSKLPGFKLPKVDTSGVPIPEEITVIDANAQRISVKTPTKVVDTKAKHDAHFTKFDITVSPEISKTTVKLPKITPADLSSEELLIVTKVDLKKPEKKYKAKAKQSDKEIKTEVYKREHIIIPGKESTQEAAILQAQETEKRASTEGIKFEYDSAATLSSKESEKKSKKAKMTTPSFGITKPDIKIPDIGIDLPKQNISEQKSDDVKGERTIFHQEVKMSKIETWKGKGQIGGVISDIKIPEIDSIEYIDSVGGSSAKKDGGIMMVNLDAAKPKADISFSEIRGEVKDVEAEGHTICKKLPKFGAVTADINVNVPDADKDINIDGTEIKTLEREGKGSKFKTPNLGISVPKVKGPKIDLSLSKKDVDVTPPEAKAEVKPPEVPEVDVTLGDVSVPKQKMKVERPELDIKPLQTEHELDGQKSKFKMPKFGITMPKVKGSEIDFSSSKKVDMTLPEAKAEVKLPDVELKEPSAEVKIKAPEIKVATNDTEGSPSKFKMPTFKLPKFGVGTQSATVEVPDTYKDVKIDGDDIKFHQQVLAVDITAPSIDTEDPSIDMKAIGTEYEGKGSKFKMPHLGFSMPKVKGPQIDLSLSEKDVDVTLPESNAEVQLPEAPKVNVSLAKADVSLSEKKLDVKKPELDTEVELDEQESKFKMPKLGLSMPKVKGPEIHFGLSKKDGDVTLPEAKAEVKVPEVELKEPFAKMEIKADEIKGATKGREGSPSKFKMPTFKLPKFGVGTPNVSVEVPDMDKDVKIDGDDINIPEAVSVVNIAAPSIDIEGPSIDMKTTGTEQDGKGSKFKMPHLGFSMSKVKGPKIDLSLSKKDVDVTLPEGKADLKLPEVDFEKVDVSIPEAKMELPEGKPEVKLPEAPKIAVEIKPPEYEAEMDGHGGKFQIPTLGMKMSKVKGPEFDLSLSKKEVNVKLPETKADVKLPEVDLGKVDVSLLESKMEVKKPELQMQSLQTEGELDGQGEKFKMPKFGITMPKVKGPEIDLNFSKKDVGVTLPKSKAEVKHLEAPKIAVDMKPPECETEIDGEGSKFKMPKFGITIPKVQGPEIDLSLLKKDVDVKLPEAKAEVKLPKATEIDINLEKVDVSIPEAKMEVKKTQLEIKSRHSEGELDGQGSKIKMPKFGMSMPKVKGPEIDLRFSKKDVTLTEAKAEVELPEAPKIAVDMKPPECEAEIDGQREKLKMPKFGITMPKITGPEFDLSLSKKEGDVTLPEAKAEVKLPDVDLKEPFAEVEIKAPEIKVTTKDREGSPSKFKMPTFKLPKFGVGSPSATVEVPDTCKDIKIDRADIKFNEDVLAVDITAPSIDTETPSIYMKTTGTLHEGKESKFKMPSLGFSVPQVKRPDIDLSLSKKDVDVTLPEAKDEVQLPDVEVKGSSAKVEVKAPEIEAQTGDVEGSPAKFKMPTFTLPKFGAATPKVSVEVPDVDKDIKIDGVKLEVPREGATVDVTAPSIDTEGLSVDVKAKGSELEGSGSKFKIPKFGISMPKVKGPEIDLNLSKKDVDVTLPEAKAEVQLPDVEVKGSSAKVEVKAPEIEAQTGHVEGSPAKFKMPTFTLPKIGAATPKVSVEVPDVDKDIKIDGVKLEVPREGTTVDVTAPSIDTEGLSVDVKAKGSELEGSGSKFKMPKFGISMPKVKGPEIDLNLSKKHVDVTFSEAKAEVQLPDVEVKGSSVKVEVKAPEIEAQTGDVEGSPAKFKMPTFTLPKFGAATPKVSVEVPDVDKDIKIDGAKQEIPREGATVDVTAPSIDTEGLSVDVKAKGSELEGSGSKFKMPKFGISMPKVKGPEIDLNLSKKDVDVTLPEAKAEVQLPDVKIKQPSAEVEIKAPEIQAQTGHVEGSPSKYKMPTFTLPKFGAATPKVSVEVPDVDKDIKIDGAKLEVPIEGTTVDVTAPSIDTEGLSVDVKVKGGELEGSGSKFKMPKFGISMPKVKGPEIDLSLSKKDVDVTLPGAKAEVKLPDVEVKEPEGAISVPDAATVEVEAKLKRPNWTFPKFSFSRTGGKAPDVDVNLETPNDDVTSPEAKAEVCLPDVEVQGLSGAISMEEPPAAELDANLKKTRFSLPKFSFSKSSVKEAEVRSKLPHVDVSLPEVNVEVKQPEVELIPPEGDVELDGKESKFKMPKFGISMPKVKGPEIDLNLSKKDVDVTLPEAKAEVQLPDVKIKQPSAKVEIKAPEIEAQTGHVEGSLSKFKMPTFTLPKFGAATPKVSVEVPDVDKDIKIDGAKLELPKEGTTVDVTAPSIDTEGLSVDVKVKGGELEGSGSKFKMPKFGISMPKVKGPEIDLNLSKKDVDVTLPEAKAEVQLPDVKIKQPSVKVEIKAPEIEAQTGHVEGSPSKFKMPTFTLPKFGAATPKVSVEVPDVDKDIKIDGAKLELPKEGTTVDVTAPSIDTEGLSVDVKVKGGELEGSGSKFKMPKFGISMPKVKGPEIDLNLSKKDVDVTLPEAKAEVQLPDVKIKQPSVKVEIKAPEIEAQTGHVEGSPSKFKMPTFTLPKFGAATPKVSVEVPDVDKDIKIDGAKLELPKEGTTVDVTAPSIDTEGLSVDVKVKGGELEGSGSKFKMPKFGISMPKVKGPEIDLSSSKKDVDVTLPEAKAEVQLPDVKIKQPSVKVEIKAPEIEAQTGHVEGSPSKFKMPTFTLPKFGAATPKVSVEVPDVDKDIKIDGAKLELPKEGTTVDVTAPSIDTEGLSVDVKVKGGELEGSGSKFKMPKFGISMPKVKGPEIDLSSSKKDVDVTLPEAKTEVQLPDVKIKQPSAKVEVKAPEIEAQTGHVEGSPSKFKMPTFTLPKFGAATPKVSVEVPDVDKDIKIDGAKLELPKEGTTVDVTAPSIDTEGLSVDVKVKGGELEGSGSKFKMPKFGISMPKVKGPEIDLSSSKKDVDVTLPEAKAEVQLPDVKIKQPSAKVEVKAPDIEAQTGHVEGSPSKFKMPTFTLPKFGAATPKVSVEVPDVDKDIKIDGAKLELPKEGTTVDVTAPSIDTEGLSVDLKVKGGELEGSGSKFKMPKFGISMPKVKGPEIDLSSSKKDVDVTLPEAKAEVQLPDVKIKQPSAKVEIKAPDIEAQTGHVEGSPSKFKMPTFTLPKFGAATPKVSVEVPDVDKDIKSDGVKLEVRREGATVDVTAPSIDTEGLSVDVKAKGSELEGSGSKFKMPKFGISMPKVKGPEIDLSLSKKDVDVTLPEAKAEVKLPDVEVKEPEGAISVPDAATVEVEAKLKRPNWTFPKFSFSRTGGKAPDVDVNLETPNDDVTSPEAKAEVCLPDVEVQGLSGAISMEEPPAAELDANLKKTKFSLPKFSFSKSSVKEAEVSSRLPHVDVSLPEVNVEVKQPEVELKPPEGEVELDGKESKFKMPKFGISMPKVKGPEIDLSLSKKDVDVTLPEAKAEVQLPDVKIKQPSVKVEIKAPEIEAQTGDVEGSPSKFKMPTFTLPKFGAATPKVNVEAPDVDKDIKIDGAKLELPKEGTTVDVTAPSIDTEGLSVDVKAKGSELEGSGSKFKMPKFGISMPKVKGPEIDLNLSKKDVDVTLPKAKAEVKLPDVEVKEPEGAISVPDAPTFEVEAKLKRPNWTFPKFSFSRTGGKAPDVDVNLETPNDDVTSPEAKAEVCLPDVEVQRPSGAISMEEAPAAELDANLKKTKFSLPKFSFSKSGVKEAEVRSKLPHVDVSLPEVNVEVKQPEVELTPPEGEVELDGKESKYKMPKFGISMPKVKGPEIDLSSSKKDVDVTLPEAKAEVQLPDVKIKQPSVKVEIKAPEIEAQTGHVEGSPSKFKMPTFTLPKFGAATPKVSVEAPDVDKDIKIDGAKLEVPREGTTVDVTAPSIDTEGLFVDVKVKGGELEGSGSKFKMPKFGISMPKVKGPEIDLSLSKKDVDVTLPEAKTEVKLPDVEVKEPEGAISVPDAATVEVEAKLKRPNWTFPKFSFSRTGGKAPDVDVNLETPNDDVTSPEGKAEVCLPDVEVQGPSGAISVEEPPAAELDANLKKTKFSLPRFSFSKSSVKEPDLSAKLPHVDVSLPEGEVKVKQPEMPIDAPELEAEHDGQGSKFKLLTFGIAQPKAKGPEKDLNASQKDVDITLPEVKAEVKLPEIDVKESSASVEIKASETEAKSKDDGGSPLKFKMPTVKMPKFGGATYDVTVESPDADKVAEADGAKLKEVNIKGLSVDIKTDVSKAAITDSETTKTETDSVGLTSPSKFKLPSFKMPKLSFSRPKAEEEYVPCKEDQLEMEVEPKGERKSPKMTLTSFGEILKNVDVEFDVPKVEESLETSKKVHETDEPSGKQLETKETNTKQDTVKSPERTGWFKFPKFGLSSPSEPARISEKDTHKDEKSLVGETVDEEISPTCSVQSSDAFADISSAMTSEHVGLSLSSPTKVTVKYSDPNAATGLGEIHSNIITSTTRTELISVEPDLPEKITIPSSGVSSSSEDTLRLESGKIHVITSNIQATPEAQHAKLLTAIQVQSTGGLLQKSEANEASSWTVEDLQSGKRTVYERHLVRETSSEKSESKETIVITKQITHMFDSSVSGETASSIQRLRDSVHSEKMRFFDGAEK